MALQDRRTMSRADAYAGDIDAGLRSHMLRVYNYMTSGLLLTGLIAYFASQAAVVHGPNGEIVGLTQFGAAIYQSPLMWLVMLAPLGFVFAMSLGLRRFSFGTLQLLFWAYAGTMGLSLSTIFLVYTSSSVASVFFITAAMFATMSLIGYTTKKDLSKYGSFLMMGVIGLLIAMVVNMFIGSSAMQFAISVLGVLIFTGLTAYDTQTIKELYVEGEASETSGKKALMGALSLYINFVMIFQFLLSLLGNRQ